MKKRNIYLLYAISLLQGMIFYGPVATLYRHAAGISVFQITLIESISVTLMILLEVPWGRVARTRTAVLAVAGILLLRMIYALLQPLQTNLQNRAITVDDRATALSLHAMLLDSTAIFTNLVFGRLADANLSLALGFGAVLSLTGLALYRASWKA
mgnify:CR=1 FL=1